MSNSRVSPPLKHVGGKYYMAKHIHALAPPHITRVIPFAGGLGEFWNWPHEGVSEIVGDLDKSIINFYAVLRSEELFKSFKRRAEATSFSRDLFEQARDYCLNLPMVCIPHVEWAWNFFICRRFSMLGAGKSFAAISTTRVRRGMNEQVSAWLTAVEGLPEVHARLRRVVVENVPALTLLKKYDSEQGLAFVDPPYFPSTRTKGLYGPHEMTAEDHYELLDCLKGLRGRVMLSGYDCPEYAERLSDWRKVVVEVKSAMTKGKEKPTREECLWMNYWEN